MKTKTILILINKIKFFSKKTAHKVKQNILLVREELRRESEIRRI